MVYNKYNKWGNFCKKNIFNRGKIDQKIDIWAFSAIYALSFWVANNWIHIDIAYTGYSYLKSTRKELSKTNPRPQKVQNG